MCAHAIRTIPKIDDAPPLAPEDAPLLTILVPAKDEAATIEHGLAAKLSSNYPNLEILVIDDRSTDGTGAIAARVAERDPRVRVIRIDTLPEGWLGKLHALDHGMHEARGEWVLMSDADVAFSPELLNRSISFTRDADFLALMPHFEHVSFAVDALMHDFLRTATLFADANRIADPASSFAVGGGVFNLVRRSAYEKTPGFSWLKLEVGDDVAFGQMMKRSGARCRIADGRNDVHLVLYPSVVTFVRGMTKGAWPVLARFSMVRLTIACGVVFTMNMAPIAMLAWPSAEVRMTAALALAFSIAAAVIANRVFRRAAWPSLFTPFAGAFTAVVMFVAGTRQCIRGGIDWRGTFYANDILRGGQRLKMPWEK